MTERERELQMARREGYLAACAALCLAPPDRAQACARERYPITVTRPRVVTMCDGWQYRIHNGMVESRYSDIGAWEETNWPISDYIAIASLAANPTEEVSE